MEPKDVVRALGALAQDSRLAIYRLLVEQGPSGIAAGEIGAALGLPPATLSFHLKELSNAGLVKSLQQSRYVFYSADFEAMNSLLAYLTENCCAADCGPCSPVQACKPAATSQGGRKAARPSKGVKA